MSSIDSAVVQARRAAAAAPVAPRPIVPNHVRVAVATEHSTRRFHGLLNEPYQVRFYERCDRVEVRGIPPSMEERACHVWVEQPGNQPFHLILIGKRIFNLLPTEKKVDRDAQEALACAVYRHESAHGRHTTKDRAALTRAETEARIDHPTWNAGEDVRIESHERSESGRRLGWVGIERIGAVDLQRPAQYVTIHRHFEDDVAAAERYLSEQGVPPAEVEITTDAVRALRAAPDSCAVPGIMRSFYDRIRASREAPASSPEQAPEQADQANSQSDQPESGESGASQPQEGDGGSDAGDSGDGDETSADQSGDEASVSGSGASGADDDQSAAQSGGDTGGGDAGSGQDGSDSGSAAASAAGDAGGQAGSGSDEPSNPADASSGAADMGAEPDGNDTASDAADTAGTGDKHGASGAEDESGDEANDGGSSSGAQAKTPSDDQDVHGAGDRSSDGADGSAADGADEEDAGTSGSSTGESGEDAGESIDQEGAKSGAEAAADTDGDAERETDGDTGTAGKAAASDQDDEDVSSDGATPQQEVAAAEQDGEPADPTGDKRNGHPGTASEVAEGDPAGTSATGTGRSDGTAGHPTPIPVHEGTEPANPFEEIDESVLRQIMSDPKMLKAIMESSQDLNAESVPMPEPPPDYQSSAVREYSTSSPIVNGRCVEESIDPKRVQQVAQVLAQALRGNRRNTFIEDPTEEIDLGRYLVRDRSCWLDTRENGNTEKSRLLLIVDCSGSMRAANTSPSGTPIGEARTLVAALNTIASRGLIEGHVALTKIGDGGAHYCQTMRLPVDPRIIGRIPADGAGEGLDHTLDMVHDLAKQSDTVAMFTDGCTDAAIDKSQLHRDGVWLRGLYVGNTKPDPRSGTSIVDNLKKYTDRAFIADSLEMLAIRLAADLRQKTAFRASGHGRW